MPLMVLSTAHACVYEVPTTGCTASASTHSVKSKSKAQCPVIKFIDAATTGHVCRRFLNNTCGSSGGGILTFSYNTIVIDTCSFEENTALSGAAAYLVRCLLM